MHRTRSFDLGEATHGHRKEMLVFVDTEEGSFCDFCKRRVKVPMLSMDCSGGEYGGPEVCQTCIMAQLSKLVNVVAVDDDGTPPPGIKIKNYVFTAPN